MASICVTGSSAGIGQETALAVVDGGSCSTLAPSSGQPVPKRGPSCGGRDNWRPLPSTTPGPWQRRLRSRVGSTRASITLALEVATAEGRLPGDGHDPTVQVNVLAPYVLTALMQRPGRLVYLSSGLHYQGSSTLTGSSGNGA